MLQRLAIALGLGLGVIGWMTAASAVPEVGVESLRLNIHQDDCMARAQAVLEQEGFQNPQVNGSSTLGNQRSITAVIDCGRILNRPVEVAIVVVGQSSRDRATVAMVLETLRDQMEESPVLRVRR